MTDETTEDTVDLDRPRCACLDLDKITRQFDADCKGLAETVGPIATEFIRLVDEHTKVAEVVRGELRTIRAESSVVQQAADKAVRNADAKRDAAEEALALEQKHVVALNHDLAVARQREENAKEAAKIAEKANSDLASQVVQLQKELARAAAERDGAVSAAARAEQGKTAAAARAEETARENAELRRRLGLAERDVKGTEQRLSDTTARLQSATTELANANRALADARAATAEQSGTAAAATKALTDAQARHERQLGEANRTAQQARADAESAKTRAAELLRRAESAEASLEAANARLDTALGVQTA